LTACGTAPKPAIIDHVAYRDHFAVVTPDPSLRACQSRTPKPDLSGSDAQRNLATAIVQLGARGEDCSSKLSATWESIDQANAKAATANAAATPQP
jgi:hypothetical protein